MSKYIELDRLYYDEFKELDIAFGEEYDSKQNVDEHRSPEVIAKDPRLRRLSIMILEDALKVEASDIQIKRERGYGLVRYRIGTEMIPYRKLHPSAVDGLAIVYKDFSSLDVNTRKLDQRGSFTHTHKRTDYDLRLSFVPTTRGELISIRILYSGKDLDNVGSLGFPQDVLESFKRVLNLTQGLILVTGATGSGKTTTMVTALNDIQRVNEGRKNIITIENPPEYVLDDITQIQVDYGNGLTEERALRAILMQNPDVIMVGEINNQETAKTSVRAGTSGHLVLATVHATDVLSVPQALKHYGVSSVDLNGALELVLNQALARKLCPHCREKIMNRPDYWSWMKDSLVGAKDIAVTYIYQASEEGCKECHYTGYLGRVMVIGMLDANSVYKKMVLEEELPITRLHDELLRNQYANYYPMSKDVLRHLQLGNIDMVTARELTR